MNDTSLDILIRLQAEISAGSTVAEALQKIGLSTKKLQEYTENATREFNNEERALIELAEAAAHAAEEKNKLTGSNTGAGLATEAGDLARFETPAKFDALADAKKRVAAATKELAEQNKNLRNIAQGLNVEFPIMGRLINALTSPYSAVIGAVTLLVGWWYKSIQAAKEVVIAFSDLRKPLNDQEALMEKAAEASRAYANELKNIADGEDPITKQFKDREEAIKNLIHAQDELAGKEKALKLLDIELTFEKSRQTPEDRRKMLKAKLDIEVQATKEGAEKKKNVEDEAAQREADQVKVIDGNAGKLAAAKEAKDKEARLLGSKILAAQRVRDASIKTVDEEAKKQSELNSYGKSLANQVVDSADFATEGKTTGESMQAEQERKTNESLKRERHARELAEKKIKEIAILEEEKAQAVRDASRISADAKTEQEQKAKLLDNEAIRNKYQTPQRDVDKKVTDTTIKEEKKKYEIELQKDEDKEFKEFNRRAKPFQSPREGQFRPDLKPATDATLGKLEENNQIIVAHVQDIELRMSELNKSLKGELEKIRNNARINTV